MKRRAFMFGVASLPSVAWAELARPELPANTTLAIVDPTLPQAIAFAAWTTSMKLPQIAAYGDIGELWYTTLAPRLNTSHPLTLIGLTRASDYFVLERLAHSVGHMPRHIAVAEARTAAQVTFALAIASTNISPRFIRQNL